MLTLNDGRNELWQWDTGRTLAVDADCSQVHFSNKVFGRSIDVDVIDGIAIIPDILLQTDKDLTAWAFVGTAENGYTKISKTFKVNKRNKPADYVFTPPEQTSLEEIKEKLDYLESIQDPDAIKNAVEDYLEQNPIESPVQSVNGYTGNVKLTAEDVGAISQENLQEATNEALAQAKASGEFNGKDYVLTDDDRAEIAEQAAGLVEIPEGDGKAFIVTITESGDKYTADKIPSEIYAAHNSGVPVLARLMAKGGIVTAYLVTATEDASVFQVPNFMVGEAQLGVTVIIAGNEPGDRSVSIVETAGGGGTVKTVNGVGPDENGNVEITIPDSGGNADYVGVEPAEDDIPKIFFGGTLQQTKDEAVVPFRYISKTDDFSGYAEIKAQGNSSMSYPKKNQTVKMFADEACDSKMKKDFKGWGKQNKHVYKANWIDLSHARNVVSARLWADVVKSRANYAELPELFRTTPNQGAVDGFPVKVYAAGVYQGRYTLNIPKDKWMANMDDELDVHCILCGENYGSGCFRAAANINGSDWSDEVHDVVPASIKTRWNEVISFVMNSTDEEFRANLNQYFYVDSLIDYLLFGLASCGLDAFGKNQLYMTYDGQRWIASMYDMDSTWGLYYTGGKFVSTSYGRDEYEDYVNSTGNLLYVRLEQLFWSELQTRWAELKNGALSIENIINRFERFTDIAPAELVKEDYASTTGGGKFTGIPSQSTNNIQQIRAFAIARQAWTDEYVTALTPEVEVPCTGITLSASELTFTAEGSQTLTATVSPDGCTDMVTWESNNTSIATVADGVVTAVANGSATITAYCGEYSASCSVAVSGLAEPVACTGITLDQTELNFDGEGTQTITATVTPSDTTDTVVWVSSAPAVASIVVENNVCTVQSVSNGNAVITVTCGEHSASCTVSVSGIVTTTFAMPRGQALDRATGEAVEKSHGFLSDYVDVSMVGNLDWINVTFTVGYYTVCGYDADYNFVEVLAQTNSDDVKVAEAIAVPEGVEYIRMSTEKWNAPADTVSTATIEYIIGGLRLKQGMTIDANGVYTEVSSDPEYSFALEEPYPVEVGKTYNITCQGVWISVVGYDDNGELLSKLNTPDNVSKKVTVTIPDGVVSIRWSSYVRSGPASTRSITSIEEV